MVVRASCGGGYGDGGQHEQTLWGWLAQVPGMKVVVPSNPADAGGLMLSAIQDEGPVIYLEHKLLADYWIDGLADGGRTNLDYDIPEAGACGEVPKTWEPIPIGKAKVLREGDDLTMVSVGVSVHRCLEAAAQLADPWRSGGGPSTCAALHRSTPMQSCRAVERTGRLLVVDEDYKHFSLSGELAAVVHGGGQSPPGSRASHSRTRFPSTDAAKHKRCRTSRASSRRASAPYRALGSSIA